MTLKEERDTGHPASHQLCPSVCCYCTESEAAETDSTCTQARCLLMDPPQRPHRARFVEVAREEGLDIEQMALAGSNGMVLLNVMLNDAE